jgi:DNA-binding CsgD family transcriptional regulator
MSVSFQRDLDTAIYDVAGGKVSWQGLLTIMQEHRPDTRLALLISGQDDQTQIMHQATAGFDLSYVDSYTIHYHKINVWTQLHKQFALTSTVYSTRDTQASPVQTELFASEFYHDWVKPQDDICEGVAMVLGHSGGNTISLAANVPRRAADELLPVWVDTFKSLVRPLSLVTSMQMLRNDLQHQNKNLEMLLAGMTDGAFLLSGKAHVLFCNRTAKTMLVQQKSLRLLPNHDLEFTEVVVQGNRLSNVLLSELINRGWRKFALARGDLHKPRIVSIIQLAGYGPMMGQTLPRYLLVVKDPDAKIDLPHPSVVEELLGLTVAEARVALQLAVTSNTSEVASQLKLSPNTVRNHISSILHKTSFTRSSEIASFVRSLSSQMRETQHPSP